MSDIGLFPHFGRDVFTWLAVTLLLGAPAAIATGRALARAWQPFGRAIVYASMLAAVADFLCYALFQLPVLPLYRLVGQATAGNLTDAALMLSGFVATAAILIVFAFIGWRTARAKQMREQYPFLTAA